VAATDRPKASSTGSRVMATRARNGDITSSMSISTLRPGSISPRAIARSNGSRTNRISRAPRSRSSSMSSASSAIARVRTKATVVGLRNSRTRSRQSASMSAAQLPSSGLG
jgi:hypothetical protein